MPWKQRGFNFTSETSAPHRVCFDQAPALRQTCSWPHMRTDEWVCTTESEITHSRMCACMPNVFVCVFTVVCAVLICASTQLPLSLCDEKTAPQCCRLYSQTPSVMSMSRVLAIPPTQNPQGQKTPKNANSRPATPTGVTNPCHSLNAYPKLTIFTLK